jgi:hypothetical protein
MSLVQLAPDVDPAADIFTRLAHVLPKIEVGNDRVLLAVYVRPDELKLSGGRSLYMAPTSQQEDAIQGKAALVLKVGPCVNPEGKERLRGFEIQVGDWVAVNASDGWSMNMGTLRDKLMLRMLGEASIHMKIEEPNLIW